jgi:hypothetical protein
MCRYYDIVICTLMLCEWIVYCSYVVTMIRLHVAQCYVSGYYIFVCRHCDRVTCSSMLCEWLLYCSFVITVIQLYVALCYVIIILFMCRL